MKKILIYISSMNAAGGIERVVSNLIEEWSKSYNVILCTKDDGSSFYSIPSNVEILALNCSLKMDMNNRFKRIKNVILGFFKNRAKLKLMLEKNNPDYIYTTTPMDALEVYSNGKKYRERLVASEHGSIEGYNRVYRIIKRFLYPKIYCISVPNKMDTDSYKLWGANAIYIPHLVTFRNVSKNNLSNKIVLNIGRMTADKQQTRLLQIWNNTTNKNEWELWIVGAGEEEKKIRDIIDQKQMNDSVKIIKPTKDISEIYKQASVFALTSRCEGFGMVLLEAMSFGIPCISFDCPSGPRDVVINNYNGYLIENNNDFDYAKKLQELLSMSDTKKKELGKNAFETVQNWDNVAILSQWNSVFK